MSLADYSVSNRGLRAGLVGTPEQVADQVRAFEAVGVDLLLLQCSPQLEEMERFAEQVMPRLKRLFSDWEDRWWPEPMARVERAQIPAFMSPLAAE